MNRAELILKYIESKGGIYDFENPCLRDDSDGKGMKIVNWKYNFKEPTDEDLQIFIDNYDPVKDKKDKIIKRLNQSFEGKVLLKLIDKNHKNLFDEIDF